MNDSVVVQGGTVSFPVEIRFARCAYASFAVSPDAAAAVLEEAQLAPKVFANRTAIVSLAAVEYVDGDLGPYHEVALSVLCAPMNTTVP